MPADKHFGMAQQIREGPPELVNIPSDNLRQTLIFYQGNSWNVRLRVADANNVINGMYTKNICIAQQSAIAHLKSNLPDTLKYWTVFRLGLVA